MDKQTNQQDYLYDAFISYRHSEPDILIAEKLHKLLETYRTPRHLVKQGKVRGLSRVFRDREELPTSSDLNSDIDTALQQSRFLIVICSPRTPLSKWVRSEISRFRELHGDDRILAILIEGEPGQSFPPEILGKNNAAGEINKVTEPLAADVRAEDSRKSLKKLKNEKLRILAPILGCRYDDLRQRHRERKIRRRMLLATAVSVFSLLFGMFTIYQLNLVQESEARAVENERIARENEQLALENERIAQENERAARESEQRALESESLALAQMSRYQLSDGGRLEAIKLALDALPDDVDNPDRPYVYDAEAALYKALYSTPYQGRVLLQGHGEQIQHMVFSNDGTVLATASEDYSVILWKTLNGDIITRLPGHTGPVFHCAFNSDATRIVTCSEETVRVWDTSTGGELFAIVGFESLDYCIFGPDDNLISSSLIGFQWWDRKDGKPLSQLDARGISCINFEHGVAVIRSEDSTYMVTDVTDGTGISEFSLDGSRIICSNLSSDAQRLVTVSKDSIDIWDVQSGEPVVELAGVTELPVNIAFTPDGRFVMGEADEDIVYIWNSESGKKIKQITNARLTIYHWFLNERGEYFYRMHLQPDMFDTEKPVSFNSTGSKFLVFSSGDVTVYSNETFGSSYYKERTIGGHAAEAEYAVYSPDDAYLAVSYDDNSVCIFDTGAGIDPVFSEEICGYSTDIFSADGTRAMSDKEYGRLVLWDIAEGTLLHEFSIEDEYMGMAVFSPDGKLVAGSYNDDTVKIWDTTTYDELFSFEGHGSKPTSIFFSHDSGLLAVGSDNGTIRVWDTASGDLLWTFGSYESSVTDMAFSPDSSQLATASHYVDIWDLDTGQNLKHFEFNTDGSGLDIDLTTLDLFTFKPRNVEYSLDGSRLLCFSTTDATIHVIDTASFDEVLSIRNLNSFKGATFSPDGLSIATLSLNNFVQVWDSDTGEMMMDFGNSGTTGYFIRYSNDGRRLMAAYFDGIHIYDALSGDEIIFLEMEEWYSGGIFSLDDRRILVSTYGDSIHAWGLITSTNELTRYAGDYLESCGY